MNSTVNSTVDGVTAELVVGGILLPVAALVIVFDLLVIAALIADDETVRSIRWILGNLLIAGVMGVLELVVNVIFIIGSALDPNMAQYVTTACLVYTPLYTLGNSGRVLMATFYAITVFVVVKWWNKPVLAPRNTKYFIIATVFVWVLAILLAGLIFPSDVITIFCKAMATEMNSIPLDAALLLYILVSLLLILITLHFLFVTVCLIKRQTITENSASSIALLKFGFFLVFGQGINAVGQIVCPAVLWVLSTNTDVDLLILVLMPTYTLSLLLTPILICIFFKPVRLKLRTWLCSCCNKCSLGITASQGAISTANML